MSTTNRVCCKSDATYLEDADLAQRSLPHLLVLIRLFDLLDCNDLPCLLVPSLENHAVCAAATKRTHATHCEAFQATTTEHGGRTLAHRSYARKNSTNAKRGRMNADKAEQGRLQLKRRNQRRVRVCAVGAPLAPHSPLAYLGNDFVVFHGSRSAPTR
jgi:hypothetical protein